MEVVCANLPTVFGEFNVYAFREKEEQAAVLSKKPINEPVPVRIHSQCITGDVFFSMKCDCRSQLEFSMRYISKYGGLVIYLFQEGRGIGFFNKIRAYSLQDNGADTVEANIKLGFKPDERTYKFADTILKYMSDKFGFHSIDLITNNPSKIKGIKSVSVRGTIKPESILTPYNKAYLETKVNKLNHMDRLIK